MRAVGWMPLRATVLAASLVPACGGDSTPPSAATPTQTPAAARVLVVTHTTGVRHPSIDVAARVLPELADAGQPGDLPLAWTRQHGAGRVFYTALGHRDELWMDDAYQRHVLGGLQWVLGGR
jgi:hypothetical protein